MFTQLQTLAQRATLSIILAAEGDKLRLTVQPKPNGSNAPVPPALSMVGSADEFDRDFAGAVERYQVPVASLLEQADAAAKAVSETKADKKAAPASKKTEPKKAPAKAAPTKASKAPAKSAPKKAATPKPAKPPKAAKPGETPPDRDALITMAQEYLAKLPPKKKPSRVDFIKKFKHGRRYERLFKTFNELLDAAKQLPLAGMGAEEQAPPPPAGDAAKIDAAAVTSIDEAKVLANASLQAGAVAADTPPAATGPTEAPAEQNASADDADEPALNLI